MAAHRCLILGLVFCTLALTACGGNEPAGPTPTTAPGSTPAAAASPTVVPNSTVALAPSPAAPGLALTLGAITKTGELEQLQVQADGTIVGLLEDKQAAANGARRVKRMLIHPDGRIEEAGGCDTLAYSISEMPDYPGLLADGTLVCGADGQYQIAPLGATVEDQTQAVLAAAGAYAECLPESWTKRGNSLWIFDYDIHAECPTGVYRLDATPSFTQVVAEPATGPFPKVYYGDPGLLTVDETDHTIRYLDGAGQVRYAQVEADLGDVNDLRVTFTTAGDVYLYYPVYDQLNSYAGRQVVRITADGQRVVLPVRAEIGAKDQWQLANIPGTPYLFASAGRGGWEQVLTVYDADLKEIGTQALAPLNTVSNRGVLNSFWGEDGNLYLRTSDSNSTVLLVQIKVAVQAPDQP